MDTLRREVVIDRIIEVFKKKGYRVFHNDGYSFDIFAMKTDKSFLIKVYTNVDSLDKETAEDMLIISRVFGSIPLIVSIGDSHSRFSDNILYFRFGIIVITPKTLYNIINDSMNFDSYYVKGKRLCYIDNNKLRELRIAKGYSLSQLANMVGITKKCLYEIEKGINNPMSETAKKLEKVLGERIRKTVNINDIRDIRNNGFMLKYDYVGDRFKQIVINKYRRLASLIFGLNRSPFDIVAKSKSIIITHLIRKKTERVIKNIIISEKFSQFTKSNGIIITRKKIHIKTMFPILTLDEISKIKNLDEVI